MFDNDAKDLANFAVKARRSGAQTFVLKCAPIKKGGGAPSYRTIDTWELPDTKSKHDAIVGWVRNTAEADAETCAVTTVYTVVALDRDGMLVAQVSERVEPSSPSAPEISETSHLLAKSLEMLAAAQAHASECHDKMIEMTRITSGNFAATLEAFAKLAAENRELWKEASIATTNAEVAAAQAKGVNLESWASLIRDGINDIKAYKMLQMQVEQAKLEAAKTNAAESPATTTSVDAG